MAASASIDNIAERNPTNLTGLNCKKTLFARSGADTDRDLQRQLLDEELQDRRVKEQELEVHKKTLLTLKSLVKEVDETDWMYEPIEKLIGLH